MIEPSTSSEIPEADAQEQEIPVAPEADASYVSGDEIGGSIGDRIDANPADVVEQLIEVADDEDHDRPTDAAPAATVYEEESE